MTTRNWYRLPLVLALGCSPQGHLDGFGGVKAAYILPCTLEDESGEPVPSAVGLVFTRRRSCLDEPGDLVRRSDPADLGCAGWTQALDRLGGTCANSVSSALRAGITFTLDGLTDLSDLTGTMGEQVEYTRCFEESDDFSSPEQDVVPAEVRVVSDDGGIAEIEIDAPEYSGLVRAEVCR